MAIILLHLAKALSLNTSLPEDWRKAKIRFLRRTFLLMMVGPWVLGGSAIALFDFLLLSGRLSTSLEDLIFRAFVMTMGLLVATMGLATGTMLIAFFWIAAKTAVEVADKLNIPAYPKIAERLGVPHNKSITVGEFLNMVADGKSIFPTR